MIIIRFMGGLGNQLFQYALYKKFCVLGREVYADVEYIENAKKNYKTKSRQDMAANVKNGLINLGISVKRVPKKSNIFKLNGSRRHLTGLVSRYITKNVFYICESELEGGKIFHPEIFDITNGYLDGYWQNEKYFKDIRQMICEDIKFNPLTDKKNVEILKRIKESNSVSVHVRRGDYLDPGISHTYGGICTEDYYNKAIEYFLEKDNDSFFFFFSNDMEWTKKTFASNLKNAFFIDWNSGFNDYYDMLLMSQCKNNIVANSSFSWWGAWLNANPNKKVIAPQRWMNDGAAQETICSDWIKI